LAAILAGNAVLAKNPVRNGRRAALLVEDAIEILAICRKDFFRAIGDGSGPERRSGPLGPSQIPFYRLVNGGRLVAGGAAKT